MLDGAGYVSDEGDSHLYRGIREHMTAPRVVPLVALVVCLVAGCAGEFWMVGRVFAIRSGMRRMEMR